MNVNELTADEVSRFHSKFERADSGCLEWTSETNNKGYGRFVIYRGGSRIRLLAHRLAFALAHPDLDAPVVRHGCDNPLCGEPAHLSPGTQVDNMRDAAERGRADISGLDVGRRILRERMDRRIAADIKVCPRCKRSLSIARYSRNATAPDGRQGECKDCCGDRQREAKQRRTLKRDVAA